MIKETMQKLNKVLSLDEASLSQFTTIMQLPDEIFDNIYPQYKAQMESLFAEPEQQVPLISHLKSYPIEDLQTYKKDLNTFIEEITDDDTLSENKKDLIASIFKGSLNVVEEILDGGGRQFIPVKIVKLNPDAIIPAYAHPTDAGADICAVEETKIESGQTAIVKTGIAVAIPAGYEIQVRPRSGLSLKSGLRIANAPGTIDSDYRGEIGVIMTNTGETAYVIEKGMKIAQLVIAPTPRIKWNEVATVEELGTTDRGVGGFGSTGVKQS